MTRCATTLLAVVVAGALSACSPTVVPAPAPTTPTPTRPPSATPSATTLPTETSVPAQPSAVTLTTSPSAQPPLGSAEPPLGSAQPSFGTPSVVPPTPTPAPTDAPTLTPTPAASGVSVHIGQMTLPTYPYRDFLRTEQDPLYGLPVQRLDRAAYEAASPIPLPRSYQTLVVENDYLRLTFLPELGGRLYSAVVKSTGQEIFYHNAVVKPSRYGPLLPIEDNWWLAVGGMEWAFPVQEHGYAWGRPWTYQTAASAGGLTVTLRDSAEPGRVSAQVQVFLPARGATFTLQPRLVNGTDHTVPVQFWVNAALAPGSSSATANMRFIVPVNQVVVHSRGEQGWNLPAPRMAMPWPVVAGRDLSRYDQWDDYLGFFAPYLPAGFMAVYNPDADLSVARVVAPGKTPGNKLFAFGLKFGDRSYTDDNSQYIEMWGGANTSFWPEDDIQLAPGGVVQWHETWWPLPGLGGLTQANDRVAINLLSGAAVRILSAQPEQATLLFSAGGIELARESLALSPARPVERAIPASTGSPVRIQVVASDGSVMADYQTQ
jgi:hypothetical protein